MIRPPSGPRGFSILELIVALGLSSMVLIAIMSLTLPMVRAQVGDARSMTAQMNLAGLMSVMDREMREATYLTSPQGVGFPSRVLSGCSNAALPPGGFAPVAVDPSAPMRWFAFCGDGQSLYYHSGQGCPASYACGAGETAAFNGGRDSSVSASYIRPSALSTVVENTTTITSMDQTSTLTSAVSYAAASGSNQ